MKQILAFLPFVLLAFACTNQTGQTASNKSLIDTPTLYSPNELPSLPKVQQVVDTSTKEGTKNNPENLLKFISDFSEREFRDTRKELMADGAEHQYQISEIAENDGILKYNVVIPGIEGKGEYFCNPQKGELTINWVGDKDIAQMYFQQTKVGLKNKNCNTTEFAEQCDAYDDWQDYPLVTHLTISFLNQGGIAVYTFRRKLLPK
jgi:hypothetical protein